MNLLGLLDELRVLAQNGLHYAENDYDRERYQRMLELVSNAYASSLEVPAEEVTDGFARELGHITPKIGADAAVFDDLGRLLLVRRDDDGCWCLPCGWVEPSETPEQAAIRETLEETGLQIEVVEQVAAIHRLPSERNGPHAVLSVMFLACVVGGRLSTSAESTEVAFLDPDQVTDWHRNHKELARAARKSWQGRKAAGLPRHGTRDPLS